MSNAIGKTRLHNQKIARPPLRKKNRFRKSFSNLKQFIFFKLIGEFYKRIDFFKMNSSFII